MEDQREVEKAMVSSGKYYLQSYKHLYKHLSVPQNQWFAMTKERRKRCLNKFNEMAVLVVSDRPSTSHSDSAVMVSLGGKPTQFSALETSPVSIR